MGGIAVLALLGAGCGDDGDEGAGSPQPDAETTTSVEERAGGDCADTDLTFTSAETGAEVDLTSTAAVSLEGGAAYTAYGADFDLDPEAISLFASPEVPADGNLVTLAVTVFNPEETPPPLEAGQVVTHDTSEFGILTFVVTAAQGEELSGNNSGGEGELTITSVGDTFCVEVDYSDEEKSLTGTLSAPVQEL